jgi:hypothetical protein
MAGIAQHASNSAATNSRPNEKGLIDFIDSLPRLIAASFGSKEQTQKTAGINHPD